MKQIYITSDTHFNHIKLAEVFKDRPLDFQERILHSHAQIPADALLIHLGDFCIGKDEEMHARWNRYTGHIRERFLVRGNHDNKSDSWYYAHGWDFVCTELVLKVFGRRIIFSHIPKDRKLWLATDLNIHGHTHGNSHRDADVRDYYDRAYHIEIAQETNNYQPYLLTQKLLPKEVSQ